MNDDMHVITCVSCSTLVGWTRSLIEAEEMVYAHKCSLPCPDCYHTEPHTGGKDRIVCTHRELPTHNGLIREMVPCYCGVPGIHIVNGQPQLENPEQHKDKA